MSISKIATIEPQPSLMQAWATLIRRGGDPLGMPAARPFTTEGTEPVFVVGLESIERIRSISLADLRKVGLSFDKYDMFEGKSVWGFTRDELEYLLEKLDLYVFEHYGTNKPNVASVMPASIDHLPINMQDVARKSRMIDSQFQIGSWRGEGRHVMGYIVSRALCPVLKRKVYFDVPHGRPSLYEERGAFQVRVWSTPHPKSEVKITPPSTIWGNYVDCRDSAFTITPHPLPSISIMDGDYAVAELLPNALYIHHDLVHQDTKDARTIMTKLCEKVVEVMADETNRDLVFKNAKEMFEAGQRTAFRQLVEVGIPARYNRHKDEIKAAKEKAARARQVYFEAEREVYQIEHAMLDPAVVGKKLEEEIAKLQSGCVANIQTAVIDASKKDEPVLSGYTTPIIAVDKHNGDTYMLGAYRIDLHLDSGEIFFFNLERMVDNCQGPHIDEDGEPCLGNIDEDLVELVSHYEAEAAFTLAIAFLQNPNMDDHEGTRLRNYPLIKRGEEKNDDE